ncbi:HTH domain-containing protein [Lactococcus garvieae]|nr:HTH domain-containing protein [Lactococcus garvieae]
MIIQLSLRQINILLYLLKAKGASTSSELAQSFDISVRTIKNEIVAIKDYLRSQGEALTSQRGRGYILNIKESKKKELIDFLQSTERFSSFMDHKRRANQICLDLFLSEEPIISSYWAEKFGVSQNTIFNDIMILEKEIKEFFVFIESNQYGYSLSGDEIRIRNLLSSVWQTEFTNYDISNLMTRVEMGDDDYDEYSLISNEKLKEIYKVVVRYTTEHFTSLTKEVDNYAIFSLIIRLCLSISRMKINKRFQTSEKVESGEDALRKYLAQVYHHFDLEMTREEVRYVLSEQGGMDKVDVNSFTTCIIQGVSQSINFNFEKDSQLFQNLYTHFSLRFSKENMYLNEYNPFVQEIKKKQEKIFLAVKQALKESFPQNFDFDDSFVAYVSLHFIASKERETLYGKKIQVLYVCSTGVGVASFIQQKIAKEVQGIEIVGFASVINCRRFVEKLQPDLVISVFPIDNIAVPVIEVEALVSKGDLLSIQEQVNLLLNAGLGSESDRFSKQGGKEKSEEMSRNVIFYGYMIYEELTLLLKDKLNPEYKEGFLLHVLLMVHRVMFEQQYQEFGKLDDAELTKQVREVFRTRDLEINDAEIFALTQYFSKASERNE